MKEGWEYKKLGEVCDFEGGSQPPKSEWINHSKEGYVRMLQIRDFTKSRNFEIEYVKITKKLRLCKADDILIGRYGASVGKILTGLAGAYNVAIIKSIPNEKVIAKSYIRRYFESSLFQSILFKVCASRAAQAGFSKEDICDALIPVPPLSEQQSIVDYLDSAFAKIDAMKANAEKAFNEAKDLFQASLKEMLEPKEGWEYIALSSVCRVQNGFAFNSKLFNESNNGLPLIRIRDIKRGYSLTYTDETCSDDFFVEDGDMLIGMDGDFNIGEWRGGHALLNQRVCKLIPSEKILAKFIFYFIPEALQRINDNTAFSTVKHLSSKQVNAILLPNLPLHEQQSIVDYLDDLFAKIEALKRNLNQSLAECDALKQAILRQVFE